ncbi:MAG: metalloregulator ArsR/SmtB family transcription factor [Pseudomonadota bacterium]
MTNHLDAVFSALSDPTRRTVLERLGTQPMAVQALHAGHKMALPTFLRHLKVLEQAGLVRSEKKGRVRTVHLEAAPFAEAEHWMKRQRILWEGRLDALEALVEQQKGHDNGG